MPTKEALSLDGRLAQVVCVSTFVPTQRGRSSGDEGVD